MYLKWFFFVVNVPDVSLQIRRNGKRPFAIFALVRLLSRVRSQVSRQIGRSRKNFSAKFARVTGPAASGRRRRLHRQTRADGFVRRKRRTVRTGSQSRQKMRKRKRGMSASGGRQFRIHVQRRPVRVHGRDSQQRMD